VEHPTAVNQRMTDLLLAQKFSKSLVESLLVKKPGGNYARQPNKSLCNN
jgi:hypothetical protein